MPRCSPLVLGLLVAALAGGCGSGNDRELIPQSRATPLLETVDAIEQACDDDDPDKARAAVEAANRQVSELPRAVDAELKRNLREWLDHIDGRIDNDCKKEKETPTPSPSPTPTPSPSPTPTPTPTPPEETPTATPTEPPPAESPEPDQGGGVPAPEDLP